ncbi:MAG: hypothetical protein L0I93_07415 [Atopostipes suicloacalis]|nr:hypothetical protein [Atopostipes suicloacalis]
MKYERNNSAEAGFFLLESILTLSIIMFIILTINPLIVEWLSTYQEAKNSVEENRIIYEKSMEISYPDFTEGMNKNSSVIFKKDRIKIKEAGTGVFIYESKFELE